MTQSEGVSNASFWDGRYRSADAVWLAERGRHASALDISGVALERARKAAANAGVTERIDWRQDAVRSSRPLSDARTNRSLPD